MPRLPVYHAAIMLVFSITSGAGLAQKAGEQPIRSVTELRLPEYHAEMMAPDLPARDVLIGTDGVLWVLGKRAVWSWTLDPFKLKRLPLHEKSKDPTPLSRLGTDGSSLFATSATTLYQVQLDQSRIFRYRVPGADKDSRARGFWGEGDDFWLVHDKGLFHFDRYGKKLAQGDRPMPEIEAKDRVALDPARKILWVARGNRLLKADLSAKTPTLKPALKAKHSFQGLQVSDRHLVIHTSHTVLRLDPSTSKLKQSVPVEGQRKLVTMDIGDEIHAYLFDDRLLEVFVLDSRTAHRFRLPLDEGESVTRMTLRDKLLVMLVDGRPRVFRLDGLR